MQENGDGNRNTDRCKRGLRIPIRASFSIHGYSPIVDLVG
jgi:hypothetical protein